mgnify:CR=1 FL=1
MLKQQIKLLEEEKKASDAEDQKQNAIIADQQGEISVLRDENQTLRKNMAAIMRKLGMK